MLSLLCLDEQTLRLKCQTCLRVSLFPFIGCIYGRGWGKVLNLGQVFNGKSFLCSKQKP